MVRRGRQQGLELLYFFIRGGPKKFHVLAHSRAPFPRSCPHSNAPFDPGRQGRAPPPSLFYLLHSTFPPQRTPGHAPSPRRRAPGSSSRCAARWQRPPTAARWPDAELQHSRPPLARRDDDGWPHARSPRPARSPGRAPPCSRGASHPGRPQQQQRRPRRCGRSRPAAHHFAPEVQPAHARAVQRSAPSTLAAPPHAAASPHEGGRSVSDRSVSPITAVHNVTPWLAQAPARPRTRAL